MDLVGFHTSLLGSDVRPTSVEQRLYRAFDRGYRGFLANREDEQLARATLVLAVYQTYDTATKRPERVTLCVTPALKAWVGTQIEALVRQAFRVRKGNVEGVRIVKRCVEHVDWGTRAFQVEEPARWAALGYVEPLPEWMRGRLLACR